ncbi:MAG: hypothetical protein KGH57_01920 [Candidatus Micrarchaeota archaeon]|nr:hypothetical protein [Candidatus Micrarchaeota archaeon]
MNSNEHVVHRVFEFVCSEGTTNTQEVRRKGRFSRGNAIGALSTLEIAGLIVSSFREGKLQIELTEEGKALGEVATISELGRRVFRNK